MNRSPIALGFVLALACSQRDTQSARDSQFAAVQQRGATVMGVDQYTSKHVFEDLPDGGRVVLDRDDPADTAAIRTIRVHMRDVEGKFEAGDFSLPGVVHARAVPGTNVMRGKRSVIDYSVQDRPRGAELRIVSRDAAAVAAIHAFLAFQRTDHRAAAHDTTH